MSRRVLKTMIGLLIVVSHLGVLFWMFAMVRTYLTVKQAVDLSAALAPVLAISLFLVVKDMTRNAAIVAPRVRVEFVLISFVLLAFYIAAMVLCLINFPENITSVEDLRTYFLGIESVFGLYLGYIIEALFYPSAIRRR
jgi:hypothetical protein